MLNVKERKHQCLVSIIKTTRITSLLAEGLKDRMIPLVSQNKKEVILSLAGIRFIDNAGFESILAVVRKAGENGCSFRICDVSQEAYELFRLMKVRVVFEIHPQKEKVFT